MIPLLLNALKALSLQKQLNSSDAALILKSLLHNQHFQVQSLRRGERLAIFQTVTNIFSYFSMKQLLTCKESAVTFTNNELLLGLIQAVEAEKHPNNLMICFDLCTTAATTLDLAQLGKSINPLLVYCTLLSHQFWTGDELFDVVSCYFPIDFTAPPGKNEITADDLRASLRKFMTSNACFALQGIPLAIEKLTSSIPSARIEAAQLLEQMAVHFPTSCFKPFTLTLWDALQSEIFNPLGTQATQIDQFTKCLTSIVKNLQKDEAIFKEFLKISSTQLDRFIIDESLRFVKPSARAISCFLQGLTQPSPHLQHFLEKYLEVYKKCDSDRKRGIVLQAFDIVLATNPLAAEIESNLSEEILAILLTFCSTTCVCGDVNQNSSTEGIESAFKCLGNLIKFSGTENLIPLRTKSLDAVMLLLLNPKFLDIAKPFAINCVSLLVENSKIEDLSHDIKNIDLLIEHVEKCPNETMIYWQSLVIALCKSRASAQYFSEKCVKWHCDGKEQLVMHMIESLLVLYQRNPAIGRTIETMLVDFLKNRMLASETLRRLIAQVVSC